MAEIEIRSYVDDRDRAPFEEWLADLDRHAEAKIAVALSRLSSGNISNVKAVGEGVAEYRLDWGPGYRIHFGQDGSRLIILVCGGTKVRQDRDIATAKARWADYKMRKAARNR
jgi:putative addiction module killer protein